MWNIFGSFTEPFNYLPAWNKLVAKAIVYYVLLIKLCITDKSIWWYVISTVY